MVTLSIREGRKGSIRNHLVRHQGLIRKRPAEAATRPKAPARGLPETWAARTGEACRRLSGEARA